MFLHGNLLLFYQQPKMGQAGIPPSAPQQKTSQNYIFRISTTKKLAAQTEIASIRSTSQSTHRKTGQRTERKDKEVSTCSIAQNNWQNFQKMQ